MNGRLFHRLQAMRASLSPAHIPRNGPWSGRSGVRRILSGMKWSCDAWLKRRLEETGMGITGIAMARISSPGFGILRTPVRESPAAGKQISVTAQLSFLNFALEQRCLAIS